MIVTYRSYGDATGRILEKNFLAMGNTLMHYGKMFNGTKTVLKRNKNVEFGVTQDDSMARFSHAANLQLTSIPTSLCLSWTSW